MIKKIIIYYLAFCVAIAPSFVFANTAGGTWQQVGSWQQGATTVWEAMKKEGDKLYNGYAKVKPTVKQVSSAILKGGKNATIAYAVSVIVGEAVDYVLDPANNRVIVTGLGPGKDGLFQANNDKDKVGAYEAMKHVACAGFGQGYKGNPPDTWRTDWKDYLITCNNGVAKLVPVNHIPVDQVAAQVISNADAEHEASKRFVADVASANTTAKDKENQWENTKTPAQDYAPPKDDRANPPNTANPANTNTNAKDGTNTANPPDTANPDKPSDKPFELPAFCGLAPIVCETAQKLLTLPDLLTKWYESAKEYIKDFVDWMKKEPEKEDIEKPDFEDLDIPTDEVNIQFGGSCPAPVQIPLNLGGYDLSFEVSYTSLCTVSELLSPVFKTVSTLTAIYILAGLRRV